MYRCVRCCKLEGLHYRAVPAPPLPGFRVQEATPFAYYGVDFAGPLYIVRIREQQGVDMFIFMLRHTRDPP